MEHKYLSLKDFFLTMPRRRLHAIAAVAIAWLALSAAPGWAAGPAASSRMSASQMHLRANAAMRLAPPKIRLISETHYVDTNCADRSRLITFDMQVRNDGGPLGTHKSEIWVEDDQLVLPYDGVLDEKWIPPLMSGAKASATVYVGVLNRNIGQLPGAHTVDIAYYNGTVLPNGVRGITRKPVTIVLPTGICQPSLRVASPGQVRLKASKIALPPSPCIGGSCRRVSHLR